MNCIKKISLAAIVAAIALAVSACGGSSSSSNDEDRLVGKWVVDRILGDTDNDDDSSTLFYEADGTGRALVTGDIIELLWMVVDGRIITTIPEFSVELESEYELSASGNILDTFTTIEEDTSTVIHEKYYRFLENHPEEFIGSWQLISRSLNGEAEQENGEAEVLNLEDEGVGSVRWGVTEDRLLLLNIDTLVGGAWEFDITESDQGTILTIVEEVDTGVIVETYVKIE